MPDTQKTEAPKQDAHKTATATATAAAAAFDPIAMWTAGQAAFQQMMVDTMARAAGYAEEFAALEHQMVARAQGAVAGWAQLAQDAIAYSAQLSAQARKLGFETAKKFQM